MTSSILCSSGFIQNDVYIVILTVFVPFVIMDEWSLKSEERSEFKSSFSVNSETGVSGYCAK